MESGKKIRSGLFEWYESLVFALSAVMLCFVFFVRIVSVSGSSMSPTLENGDRIALQSFFYTPQRGDIIVTDSYSHYGDSIVKRIIALGGDVVDIDFIAGVVTVNGRRLEEPYLAEPTLGGYDVQFPLTVPDGHVFVMGDNRPHSLDSRSSEVGFIDERDILGKVLFRVMPVSEFGPVS